MARPILEQSFWSGRLKRAEAKGELHRAVFECPTAQWRAIERKHREILRKYVGVRTRILDVGCGWGRLFEMLPAGWGGEYLGVDLSYDFIKRAREGYPGEKFQRANLLDPHHGVTGKFDLAICISIRSMIQREVGGPDWDRMRLHILSLADRILGLEYDPDEDEWVDDAS